MSSDTAQLTHAERRTYQSLRDRGFDHETALQDALDGVQVEGLRARRVRKPVERRLKPIVTAARVRHINRTARYDNYEPDDDDVDFAIHQFDGHVNDIFGGAFR